MFAISHDDHYFQHADRLLEMRAGQLSELTRGGAGAGFPRCGGPYGLMLAASPGEKPGAAPLKFSATTLLAVIISPPRAMLKASGPQAGSLFSKRIARSMSVLHKKKRPLT